MSVNIAAAIWAEFKPLLATSDRPDAAEAIVNIMIDNDIDPADIKKAFKKDGNIMNALGIYDDMDVIGQGEDDDEDEDDEEDFNYYSEDDDY